MSTAAAPQSRREQLLRVLEEGPSTSGEVAIETGMTAKLAASYLGKLAEAGHVRREPFRIDGQDCWLWKIA